MPRFLTALVIVLLVPLVVLMGGRDPRPTDFAALAQASLAQIDGSVALPGLQDSVEVIRDRWGVPHIYARNVDDLFYAQGYVTAQDRLWQMDLYRRTYEGRLAEILGPDYVAHDRLARLVRYRGPMDEREWTAYHPEGRRIFDAYAAGVNAFIAEAGDELPVEFRLTGIRPLGWTAEASVLRTQTAMPLGDARAELSLARSVAELGTEEANRRANPSPWRALVVPEGTDVGVVDPAAARSLSGLRGPPSPPVLEPYASWPGATANENGGAQENSPGSNNWAVSGRLTASGQVMVANDPHRNVANPSIRYIVHLNAPGWDIIGATEAPLPGVAIGHNGRIAWGLTIVGTDQSDVYVETVHPEDSDRVLYRGAWEPLRVEVDTILVQGAEPVVVEHRFSRHGPIFHEDAELDLAYALRSTMHEPGTAGYLGALRYHALGNCTEFLEAQVHYAAPTENMVCGDAAGNIAWQASALSPRRPNWHGRLPVPGTGAYEWDGFRDDLPREFNPARGWIATANHDIHPEGYDPPLYFKRGPSRTRFDRLTSLFEAGSGFTMADMQAMQLDAYAPSAAADAALFRGWTASGPELERWREALAAWDGHLRRESAAAAVSSFVSRALDDEALAGAASDAGRQALLEAALLEGLTAIAEAQGEDPAAWRWGRIHRSEFPHDLVAAYDIPAVERSGGSGTVAATGATFRHIVDFADLDGSMATNAPGQSAQPGSPFYANLVDLYGRGEYFPLSFTRAAVERNAAHTLVLVPGGRR